MIRLHDKHFVPFINSETLQSRISDLSKQVANDLGDIKPLFVGILNGSFMFVSDFLKNYPNDCELSFIKLASYVGTESSQQVRTLFGLDEDLTGRTVVILEDIVDTGHTLEEINHIFKKKGVERLLIATLFFKPESYKKTMPIDYTGFEIPNKFIVGFGLDYDGLGRNLPQIYQLHMQEMKNIVLFGPPGAGKGTQATILKEKYHLVHISTGDVFRYNIKNSTPLGEKAKMYIDKGLLVPDSITIGMLEAEVEKNPDAGGFIFDGFPRTKEQAKKLDELLKRKNQSVNAMIALEVADDILVERLLERGKTSGRPDDSNEMVIRKRIKVYYDETAILKEYYQTQNKYFGINGIGEIEDITQRISHVIDTL